MHAGAPIYLLALLLVPLAVALAVVVRRRRSNSPLAYTNVEILAGVASSRAPRRTWIPLVLLVLALALASTAVARPSVTLSRPASHSVVVLLVDVSGSMQADDVKPTRIAAAVDAMQTFIKRLPNKAEVGLIQFSSEPAVISTPTTDHASVQSALELLGPEGATALGDGVGASVQLIQSTLAQEGVRRLADGEAPAAIVLLSDGAQNRGVLQPLQAAALAKKAGIRVYTVALGTPTGTVRFEGLPRPVPVPPDPATLRAIASATGGQSFNAQTAGQAENIYKQLGSTVGRKPQRYDLSSWFSFGAAIVLLSAVTAGLALGPTLP